MRLLLILTCLSALKVAAQSDSLLFWSPTDSLQWSDFKGIPDTLSYPLYTGGYANAVSALKLEITTIDSLNSHCYQFTAAFNRFNSWNVSNGEVMLDHERGHFALMEINVRRLRKRLLELATGECEIDISIREEINREYSRYDSIDIVYDETTAHGGYPMPQRIWDEKIRKELSELEEYSEDTVICFCQK